MRTQLLIAAAALSPFEPFVPSPTTLTEAEMAGTIGGVGISSFTTPASNNLPQYEDNVRFSMQVINGAPSPRPVGVWSGSSQYATGTVPVASGMQQLSLRSLWPIDSTKRNVRLRYKDMDGVWQDSDPVTRNDVHLSPTLKVAKVRFYNLQEPGGANPTTLDPYWPVLVTDNLSYTYSWNTTESMDAIMEQCPTTQRWNFRLQSSITATVPAGCTNPRWGFGSADVCGDFLDQVDSMITARAAVDGITVADYLHVVIVNSHGINDFAGGYALQAGYSAPGYPFVVLIDTMPFFRFSSVITHEVTHRQLGDTLCHIDEWYCLDQYDPNNDCGQGVNDRNLMCGNGAGRQLTSAQCATMSSTTTFLKDSL
jgi:hypothetical protein